MIRVTNLIKNYGDVSVLKGVSTNIEKREIISIIGPSGCGKSTFLRCINRLETPSGGEIYFENVNITDKKTNVNEMRKKQPWSCLKSLDFRKKQTLIPTN